MVELVDEGEEEGEIIEGHLASTASLDPPSKSMFDKLFPQNYLDALSALAWGGDFQYSWYTSSSPTLEKTTSLDFSLSHQQEFSTLCLTMLVLPDGSTKSSASSMYDAKTDLEVNPLPPSTSPHSFSKSSSGKHSSDKYASSKYSSSKYPPTYKAPKEHLYKLSKHGNKRSYSHPK